MAALCRPKTGAVVGGSDESKSMTPTRNSARASSAAVSSPAKRRPTTMTSNCVVVVCTD
jgi:hypothetical protein